MRHGPTNSARDSRLPAASNTEAEREGIRSLDCGHEVSQDGDLIIRRSAREAPRHTEPIGLLNEDGSTSFGEQQQSV